MLLREPRSDESFTSRGQKIMANLKCRIVGTDKYWRFQSDVPSTTATRAVAEWEDARDDRRANEISYDDDTAVYEFCWAGEDKGAKHDLRDCLDKRHLKAESLLEN